VRQTDKQTGNHLNRRSTGESRQGKFGKLLNKNFVWDKVVISEKQKKKKSQKKSVSLQRILKFYISCMEKEENILRRSSRPKRPKVFSDAASDELVDELISGEAYSKSSLETPDGSSSSIVAGCSVGNCLPLSRVIASAVRSFLLQIPDSFGKTTQSFAFHSKSITPILPAEFTSFFINMAKVNKDFIVKVTPKLVKHKVHYYYSVSLKIIIQY